MNGCDNEDSMITLEMPMSKRMKHSNMSQIQNVNQLHDDHYNVN